MDRDRLRELATNPNHIVGIYNYCNRWCEHCTFTSRCLLYATEKEDEDLADPETMELDNKKFWQKIHESFQLTLEMVREDAERFGIDIDNLPDDPELMKKQKDDFEAALNHPLAKRAKFYMKKVMDWFDNNPDMFKDKWEEFERLLIMDNGNEDPEGDANLINDAVEVIKWYFMQIGVKLSRAFNSRFMEEDEREEEEFPEDFISDADGSAKVSLIGIDDSIAAWGILLQHFPGEENFILDMLVLLEKLRRDIEIEFPAARSFHRIGFDD